MYRAPCGRRMRDISDVDKYLALTDSLLTIDLFSFEPGLKTDTEYEPRKVRASFVLAHCACAVF